MTKEIENIKQDIRSIKDNHLAHMEKDISIIKVDLATVSTNQDWLMRFFWIIAAASIGGLLTGIFNLIL